MTHIAEIYKKMDRFLGGRWLFTKIVCFRAPYFKSIRPMILDVQNGKSKVKIQQRRSINNHLGTIHAIALCNLCELALGMVAEATVPKNLRWIPKGMSVRYLKKATGSIIANCEILEEDLKIGDNDIDVYLTNNDGVVVMDAKITLYLSNNKKHLQML